jgi:hypothetical protein
MLNLTWQWKQALYAVNCRNQAFSRLRIKGSGLHHLTIAATNKRK